MTYNYDSRIHDSRRELKQEEHFYKCVIDALFLVFFVIMVAASAAGVHWHHLIANQQMRSDLYWQDSVGRIDIAMRYAGGQIIENLTTTPAFEGDGSDDFHPAYCALEGQLSLDTCCIISSSRSQIGIRFSQPALVEKVTLDDIPHELLTSDESTRAPPLANISSVSPDVRVPTTQDPTYTTFFLMKAEYSIKSNSHIQTFDVPRVQQRRFEGLVMEITNNWGSSSTRLCRVRVHGS
ncbi:hypothetical protein BJ165DRAFT_1410368 [Panaeolus papilionaceus]|nr:hypothetical protein BJ165DRAFT_1410368 [Panaeolus papilionaceus]